MINDKSFRDNVQLSKLEKTWFKCSHGKAEASSTIRILPIGRGCSTLKDNPTF